MTPVQTTVNRYLQHFSQLCGTQAELRNGVCALCDSEGREMVTMEVPPDSEVAILSCVMRPLPEADSAKLLQQFLLLNFEISAMKGCWLALNDKQEICLCNMVQLERIDEQSFSHTLIGFIDQAKEVKEFVGRLIENTMVRTA